MPLKAMRQRRVERWNQRLVSEESAFYTQIGVGHPDLSEDGESCDVLRLTAVQADQFSGDEVLCSFSNCGGTTWSVDLRQFYGS